MMWICRIASLTIFLVARANSKAVVTDTGFASSDVYVTDEERLAVWEINNGKRAGRFIDGDISFSLGRSAITEGLWPNKRLPYKLGTGLTLKAIAAIELAFQEFRLRTCIDFVLQSTESDYLEIVPLEGCSSYIGLKGGKQQLSIGDGCETVSIVIHELMHAIGFYHEHSRFDRDDYVDIISSAIKPGKEHNFKKYDVSQGNPRRVAYDFSSVMQYGGTYFSNDGTTRTMVTRNPAFQDLIGEAYTFSIGDTTKINRMYNCGDTLLYSYYCDFEDEALCGFTNYNRTDGLLWEFHKVGVNITTLSQGIPSLDATYGVTGQGGFMILNASTSAASGQRAETRSMRYITKSEKQCLYFSHYMANTAESLGVSLATVDDATGEITETRLLKTVSPGSSASKWIYERMTIEAPASYRLIFSVSYEDSDAVVAIDDVSIQDKPCDDAYHVEEDISQYATGASFNTAVLKTEQGYSFRLKIFPNGRTQSTERYPAIYIHLYPGDQDSILEWPLCDVYLQVSVVDQTDPSYAMNAYREIVTVPNDGGLWERPVTHLQNVGWTKFMRLNKDRRNYLKLDRLIISVLTRDMKRVNGGRCSSDPAPTSTTDKQITTATFSSAFSSTETSLSTYTTTHTTPYIPPAPITTDESTTNRHTTLNSQTVSNSQTTPNSRTTTSHVENTTVTCRTIATSRKQTDTTTTNQTSTPQQELLQDPSEALATSSLKSSAIVSNQTATTPSITTQTLLLTENLPEYTSRGDRPKCGITSIGRFAKDGDRLFSSVLILIWRVIYFY